VRQRICFFLVVLLLIFSGKNFAQQKTDSVAAMKISAYPPKDLKKFSLSPDFYSTHLGLFCKKELLFQKKTTIPLRLRLGSLEYVNRLEGKKQ